MDTRTRALILALVATAGIYVGLRLQETGQGVGKREESNTVQQAQEQEDSGKLLELKPEVQALSAPSEPPQESPNKDKIIVDVMMELAAPHKALSRESAETYYRLVKKSAEEKGFDDPMWLLAMIFQESKFDADVVSSHGAVGLMQILPKTAKGEFGVGRSELFKPEVNVPLGVTYLAKLRDHYNGDLQLAITAYNQGLGNVDKGMYSKRYLEAVRKHYDIMTRKIDERIGSKR
ncbi:lytic transglycosylase domain-containing protein [Brevibacillus sp. SYP-B805]|uniref:lytic transglycosylase domain-containing protein n=1 Tax=Brevibacillus sp. SYP-B805 TaxID=1578199 RepID=UPI0013EAECA4|nr:lytic transglycosylase domain-containing protein [Brevibacillus sp. SYP-B805]NGQ95339.1 lytic transglycosylase domain-containing protein [Brevibacillus sp. SYP-B805]